MSGSRTFLNFGAKTPPDRRPVRQARSAALHNGLRALGWENGHNVRIEWRWASGDEATRLSDYAAELVKLSPNFSSRPEVRRSRLLRGESALIPIVFVIVSDPVAPGFVPGVRPLNGSVETLSAHLAYLKVVANALVKETWDAIEKVAAALLEKGTLDWDQLCETILDSAG